MKKDKPGAVRAAGEEGIEYGMLPTLYGYQLRRAHQIMFNDLEPALKEFQLSVGFFTILVLIEANPGLRQTQLANAARLDRSTIVSVIDKLERLNLVVRRADPNDRRSNCLELTAEGAKALVELKKRVQKHDSKVKRALTDAELQTLSLLLDKIRAAYDPEGG